MVGTATFDGDSRVCIYPCYLNSQLSETKGRKIPKSKAVVDPTTPQIFDIVSKIIQLPAEMERKRHPIDWRYLGRVRVSLKDSNGSYIKEDLKNKKALMLKVAELLPRHPAREEQQQAEASKKPAKVSASGGVGALPARKKK